MPVINLLREEQWDFLLCSSGPLNRLLIEVLHFSIKQLDESGNNLIKRRIQSRDQCRTDAPASFGARRPIFPFHILD